MMKMTNGKRSFIPIIDTWKELDESTAFFYWASLLDLEFVSFLPLELDSSTSVISSMVEKIP